MISDLHRRRLEPAESLAFAEKARPLLDRLVAEHPEDTYSRIDLARCHNNIGRMRRQSGEPAEALRSFRRTVNLLEGLPELDAAQQLQPGVQPGAVHPADRRPEGDAGRPDPETLTKGDRIRRRLYGDRAVAVLRRAVRGGFLNGDVLLSDPDLAAIRGRDDFQEIVKELEKRRRGGNRAILSPRSGRQWIQPAEWAAMQ